jgi:polar amino acid transport system substrate-binding protein
VEVFGISSNGALWKRAGAAVLPVFLVGCDYLRFPRDPDGTLEAVLEAGEMDVAVVHHPPWVIAGGEDPSGAEVALVEEFAEELEVSVAWRPLSAFAALEALDQGEVDLAVGGFTQSEVNPHAGAAPTYAYFSSTLLIAAPPEVSVPEDPEGWVVLVPPDVMAAQFVRDKGAVPVEESGAGAEIPLVALPHWRLEARGLISTGIKLRQDKHVMAVPQGENAWLMRVERFLRRASDGMGERLRGNQP